MKRVIIVHGWDSNPDDAWFPWLKRELERRGFIAKIPPMPHPEAPAIEPWVKTLIDAVKNPDEETYFIGHSVGGQTILRYLERLDAKVKVGGVVLVAPWMTLTAEALPDESAKNVAEPWVTFPLDWNKIKK